MKRIAGGIVPPYERGKPRPSVVTNITREKARSGVFRKDIESRRCLVPASGYYEWQDVAGTKHPHLFTHSGGTPFAAVWEPARGPFAASVAILTTEPNRVAGRVHNRMPVVLSPDRAARWIGGEPLPDAEFAELTMPLADGLLEEREVNRYVSNSSNEGSKCIAPPDPPAVDPQLSLF